MISFERVRADHHDAKDAFKAMVGGNRTPSHVSRSCSKSVGALGPTCCNPQHKACTEVPATLRY
jgi:hypothetical protein